jgi:manganese/zinc/iron transport system permease protein
MQRADAAAAAELPPWLEFFTFPSVNVVYVLVGCLALSAAAGVVGAFAFLRKRSLMGDALAHAALPGVCMAFLLTGTKNPLIILLGAAASCWAGAYAVEWIVRHTRCKEDSALGMVLSVFFGVGILLLTHIQQSGDAAQSGLDKFLFGQAAALVRADLYVIAPVGAVICLSVFFAYKELKVFSFDPAFAEAAGMPARLTEVGLATLIVLAVAIGLQAVGVVLMAALLVTPAAAARYWTERLGVMLVLSGVFGAFGGFLGAYVSYLSPQMPTGPWIVVAVTAVFVFSLLMAPRRGIVPRVYQHVKRRQKTARENVLRTMYVLNESTNRWREARTFDEILQQRPMRPARLRRTLNWLMNRDLVFDNGRGGFVLTERGLRRAARVTRLHRLWELYLTRRVEIAPDHVHDDAEEIEHIITPELEARLAAELDNPAIDPHMQRIPPRGEPLSEESV